MKNIWKVVLFLVGLMLVAAGIHHLYSFFSISSDLTGTFGGNDAQDRFAISQLTSMRQNGLNHLGVGLLLIHQAVKFHLNYKK
jgi:hypothetical protein